MTSEADPLVAIPSEAAPSAGRPLARPRWEAGVLALMAALAGFAAGWIGDTGVSGPLAPLLLLVAVIAIIASFALAWPAVDPLRSDGMDEFRRELDRARRHRRSFALVRLGIDPAAGAAGAPPALAAGRPNGGPNDLVRVVGSSLRITDRAWRDGDDVMIMQPETDRASAEAFADRLRAGAAERIPTRITIAVFPDDGLTSGALIDALNRAERGDPLPEPLTRATIEASAAAAADHATGDPIDDLRIEAG
jgi:hypothetical protein